MRFYNVLWNDDFFINVALFKLVYMSPESIYMLHIVENYFFIIFTHFWKISENFQTNFMNFWQFFENLLKFRFFEFHSPYLWVKKCALWVRAHKNFFVSKLKCIYLKIFCIIISLDTTVAIVQAINRVCTHIILAKLAILSNLWPLPPQHGKKWGEIFFPSGVQYFSYKNFLDLCMKFFLNTFLGATLMYSQFLRHAKFAGENKRFSAKIVNFLKSTEMCLMCAQHKTFLSHFEVH